MPERVTPAVDLYWIPLGAGGHSVRFNGRVFEALAAVRDRRRPRDLHHAALVVAVDGARHTIEVAPSPDPAEASRGVVATGPVGSRLLGRWRLFRYEVRCWPGGRIPDLDLAAGPPVLLSTDPEAARRVLAAVADVPTPVWGRDELRAGEMWNSNSVTALVLATAGLDAATLHPPRRGRAPGWDAGLSAAARGLARPPGPVETGAGGPRLPGGDLRHRRRPGRRSPRGRMARRAARAHGRSVARRP